jgi:hypothetical protein
MNVMQIQTARFSVKHSKVPSIVGLAVKLPVPCRCGSHIATIGADYVLQCGCGARRNPLSRRTIEFIVAVTRCFGAPADPVILRRNST